MDKLPSELILLTYSFLDAENLRKIKDINPEASDDLLWFYLTLYEFKIIASSITFKQIHEPWIDKYTIAKQLYSKQKSSIAQCFKDFVINAIKTSDMYAINCLVQYHLYDTSDYAVFIIIKYIVKFDVMLIKKLHCVASDDLIYADTEVTRLLGVLDIVDNNYTLKKFKFLMNESYYLIMDSRLRTRIYPVQRILHLYILANLINRSQFNNKHVLYKFLVENYFDVLKYLII